MSLGTDILETDYRDRLNVNIVGVEGKNTENNEKGSGRTMSDNDLNRQVTSDRKRIKLRRRPLKYSVN